MVATTHTFLVLDGPSVTPLVAWIPAVVRSGRVRHSVAALSELEQPGPLGTRLPPTRLLLLRPDTHGVALIRFSAAGDFAGDTWHPTLEEAKDQAAFEFGDSASDWQELPEGVEDVQAHVIELLARSG